jgi:pseudouridine kinase
MSDLACVICIGGAAVDRKYRAFEPVLPGTSNPVRGERGFGGVARNVAENLARLGTATALVSCVGADDAGRSLSDYLQRAGVDVDAMIVAGDSRTAEYSAVLNPDGSLAVAFADMAIFDHLTPGRLEPLRPRLSRAQWLFADCNLPSESLAAIIDLARQNACRLAADTVSIAKAVRLPDDLTGIDLLFLNRDEAAALLAGGNASPEEMVQRLLERGAEDVVLTLGGEGCLVAGPDGLNRVPAASADIVDVTGAGDALVAGTLTGLLAGDGLSEAVVAGTKAAAATIASKDSVIPKP